MTASAKRLRLDRTRDFGIIRGVRPAGDKHQFAHFTQDGIHFDAQGLHLEDLIEDDKTRALVDRRLKRMVAPKEEGDSGAGGGDGADNDPPPSGGGSSAPGDVNLEAWLRGEEKYQWFLITKTVRDRYSQNITRMGDMLEFLIRDRKIIAEADLSPELSASLPKA